MEFRRIVTHNDMDGVVSAALCSFALGVERFHFAGPNAIFRGEFPIGEEDVVCDLPYPLRCGLWFDHHEGNWEDLKYRGIDPEKIPGRFALKDSCSRVIWEYFSEEGVSFPPYLEETVAETDIIDSFKYSSIEEWRRETPGKVVDFSLKASASTLKEKHQYMRELVKLIRDHPLQEVIERPSVKGRYERYREEEERMLRMIQEDASFLPYDEGREIIFLDLTRHSKRPHLMKNLAFLIYPEALAVLEVHNLYDRGVKTTHLGFTMSLSINLNNRPHSKDLGEIMRSLNLGDGHKGAAAGTLYVKGKAEMLKRKEEMVRKIFELWKAQG